MVQNIKIEQWWDCHQQRWKTL